MVEATKQPAKTNFVPARKNLNRFTKWENRLEVDDKELPKINDLKQTVSRFEWKNES